MQPSLFEWLDNSQLAIYIRESSWLFPVIEIFHITGFVVLVGCAFMFDLRLLGVSRNMTVSDLAKHLLPWSRRSLWIVIPSGLLLFISQANALSTNFIFVIKLILIFIAFVNAGVFHWFIFKTVHTWDRNTTSPIAAKLVAVISILLWTPVITSGRLISYF